MQHVSNTFISAFAIGRSEVSSRRFDPVPPSRRNAIEPEDNGAYILPMKQSFMKNRRIMDSTARLLSLIHGWMGQGAPIETTQGILAKHMGKSIRQIQRMLNDAWREGFLTYVCTKNRLGMITGIRIYLRLERIRGQKKVKSRRKKAMTFTSETNKNRYTNKKDKGLEERLRRLGRTMGIDYAFE